MLHVLRAVVLVPLSEPPPPQPAIAATQRGPTRMKGVAPTFTRAPVYSPLILRRTVAGVIVVAGLLAGLFAQAGGASPIAHAASFSSCDISGQQQDLGASYVTSLKVQGVSCAKAEKVIKAYHQCRHQTGGPAGNCDHKVLGFSARTAGGPACRTSSTTRPPSAARCRARPSG